ncbi:guanylate kinase [Lachnospiraceae bacterium 62-35]
MGKIFYIMGKSASGKDTVYKRLLRDMPDLKTVIIYTTRPARDGERDGVEYYFTSEEKKREWENTGRIIESRTYHTIYGPWTYFTVDDGQFDLESCNYLLIGTLESYGYVRKYFGEEKVIPIYIYVEDGIRLSRALERERFQKHPRYAEMCRRFLADEEDFKEENLKLHGIHVCYENICLENCLKEIENMIKNSEMSK